MMSYGLSESEADGEKFVITSSNSIAANSEIQFDFLPFEYPPLKCNSNEHEQERHKGNLGTYDDYMSVAKESTCYAEVQDPEVIKLYARLHALEADRESMRQAIINMRTDKAQFVLLKEIPSVSNLMLKLNEILRRSRRRVEEHRDHRLP
ncbi:hypothetical protein L1887_31816 [Cichorium endivia]|nr:hypothetical protein L1887_31816 [Cichorium endivia]